MSQQPSGWYDDPSNPDMLRYWDGVTWTNHTAPKKSPTASQSTIGLPLQGQVPPDAGTQGVPTPTTPMPQGSGWQTRQPQQYQNPYQQQYQQPYQQGQQYPGAPQQAQWMYNIKTTADGVPLASYGKRVAAWLIDGVILLFVGGALAWLATPALGNTVSAMFDAASANNTAELTRLQSQLIGPSFQFGITLWLITTAYCLVFWTTMAATPGKLALGISVRRMDQPGPLSIGTALLRRVVPFISQFLSLLTLLDYLWPLWDDKRQALHDKVAKTQVVEGRQPRKQG
jgi:uncharacterized RDD family membrane protein YckC